METKRLAEISLIFIAIILVVFLLREFKFFLRPLAIAIILSFLFTPLLRLQRRDKLVRIAQIVLAILIFIALIIFVSISAINKLPQLEEDLQRNVINQISFSVGDKEIMLSQFFDGNKIRDLLRNSIGSILNSVTSFVAELIIITVLLIFIVPAQNVLIKGRKKGQGLSRRHKFFDIVFKDMEKGIRGYLKAKTVISLGTALASFIIMMLLGINHALLFAIMMFFLNYIPNFGDYISFAVIFAVQLFTIGLGFTFFLLLVLLVGVQMLFANFLEPKYTGKTLNLSPLTILLSLLFWGAVWGVGGILFSVPLTLGVKTFLKHFRATEDFSQLIS